MATRKEKYKEEDGFLLAAYDLLGDLSVEHNVSVGYQLTPTVRRGKFKIRLVALRGANQAKLVRTAMFEGEFPTAMAETFAGALYRAAVKLADILEQQRASNRAAGALE